MSSPKVTIGLPVYNGAEYLRTALDCLLAQTYDDFELVISDNGSTDDSESICRAYAARDPRIRYHREAENRGAIWNFNRVFELARGAYFKWAACDDECAPTFLARCVELLDSDPSIVWCHTQTSHIDQFGEVVPAPADPAIPRGRTMHSLLATGGGLPNHTRRSAKPHQRFAGVVLGTTWCSDTFGLIRSETLRRTHLLLPCYGAEKVLMAELALQGRFEEVPETLFFQRVHLQASGSFTTAAQQQAYASPQTASRFSSTRLKLFWGYVQGIGHAHIGLAQQAYCLVVLVRYLFQVRKWKRVLAETLTGAALSEIGPATVVHAPQDADTTPPPCEPVST